MQNLKMHSLLQETQPLVSFIIAYYDLPVQMLGACIDSILALSLPSEEREIIVIDDGSKVSPMNVLLHYGDDIIYVRQKNGGLSSARNKGIEMATGRYIQFVDADDQLVQQPYNHCLDLLRQHSEADMVLFDFTTDLTTPSTRSSFTTSQQGGTEFLRHHNIHGMACGYLFRKTTLGELRFTHGIYHEDEEFTPLLLVRSEHIIVTSAQAYYYNQRPGSITGSTDDAKTQKRLDDLHGVIARLHVVADRQPQNDRLALQRRVAQLTMDYLYQIIIQTRSLQTLNLRIDMLRKEGLFPLPPYNYTKKYTWFRHLSDSTIGRMLLIKTLPLLKTER